MIISELLEDYKFLDLLDKDNSEDLLKYISDLRLKSELTQNDFCKLGKMFKELDIYSDICLDRDDFSEDRKYVGPGVLHLVRNQNLNLKNKVLAPASIVKPSKCTLTIDNTIKILNLSSNFWTQAPIVTYLSLDNVIIFESIPQETLISFDCHSLNIKTHFKIKDSVPKFKKFLQSQEWKIYSKQVSKTKIIEQMIRNTERI